MRLAETQRSALFQGHGVDSRRGIRHQDEATYVPSVSTLLETSGLRLLDATSDARRTCALDRGYVSKTKPLSVVRYETADVSEVPRDLEQKIESGRYHAAAVGACPSTGSSGFTRYRLAILLY